jgi:hypothetical protein
MGGAAQSVLRLSIPCIAGTRGARFGMLFSRIYLEMQIRLKLLGLVIGKLFGSKESKVSRKSRMEFTLSLSLSCAELLSQQVHSRLEITGQELIAPKKGFFFDARWSRRDFKTTTAAELSAITEIDAMLLQKKVRSQISASRTGCHERLSGRSRELRTVRVVCLFSWT